MSCSPPRHILWGKDDLGTILAPSHHLSGNGAAIRLDQFHRFYRRRDYAVATSQRGPGKAIPDYEIPRRLARCAMACRAWFAQAAGRVRDTRMFLSSLAVNLADGAAGQDVVELQEKQVLPGALERRQVQGPGQSWPGPRDLGLAQQQFVAAVGLLGGALGGERAAVGLQYSSPIR